MTGYESFGLYRPIATLLDRCGVRFRGHYYDDRPDPDDILSLRLLCGAHEWLSLNLPMDGRESVLLEGATTIGSGWHSIGYRRPDMFISSFWHAENILAAGGASAVFAPKAEGGMRPVGVPLDEMHSVAQRQKSFDMHRFVVDQTGMLLVVILAGPRFMVDSSLGSLVLHLACNVDYRYLEYGVLPSSDPRSPWWQYYDPRATAQFINDPSKLGANDMWKWVGR